MSNNEPKASTPDRRSELSGFVMRWLWIETTRPMLAVVACSLFLIFSVFLIIGPMFGIAMLVDEYSDWMLLLYIPWLITLPITAKPLGFIVDG